MKSRFEERTINPIEAYGPRGLRLRFSGKPGGHVEISQMINKRQVWSNMFDVIEEPRIGDHTLTWTQMAWIEWWRNEIMGRAGLIERDPYTGRFNEGPEPK